MRGVLIAGLLGSGKTTALEALHTTYSVDVPTTVTTRPVEPAEFAMRHIPAPRFQALVASGRIVCPLVAGGAAYGWEINEFRMMRTSERFAATVRAYTALLLASTLPDVIPVWLDLSDPERQRRLKYRDDARDREPDLAQQRSRLDDDDSPYREFFGVRLDSDQDPVAQIAALYDHR